MHPRADGCGVRERKLATPCANTCVCAGRSVFGKRLKVHRGCDGHFKPKHGECPGLIAEHGQAGVTPSSCARNAAWLSGLAVCWPRRPPNRACVLHGGTPMRGRRLVCVRIPLQHSPPQHRNLAVVGASKIAPAGITPPPPSMELALTELAHPTP